MGWVFELQEPRFVSFLMPFSYPHTHRVGPSYKSVDIMPPLKWITA